MVDTSTCGALIARELDTLVRVCGKPPCVVSDSSTVFVSQAVVLWAGKNATEEDENRTHQLLLWVSLGGLDQGS